MALPAWVQFTLNALSPGELQYGTAFDIPVQVTSRNKPGYTVEMGSKTIRGSGIPASTMYQFQMGLKIPREKSLAKLAKLYGRYQYQRLKQAGANPRIADRNRYKSPREVDKVIKKMRKYVSEVSARKKVDPLYIAWGFMQSHRGIDEWDVYISETSS